MASWATKSIRIDTATPTTNTRQITNSARIGGHSKRFPMRASASLRARPLSPVFPVRRDTHRAMSEESTTPDLVERWQEAAEAYARHDLQTTMRSYAPDAVWDGSSA